MSEVTDLGNGVKSVTPKHPVKYSIPQPDPTIMVDAQTKAILDWQQAIHHELQSINGKLFWFVCLSLVAIFFSFISLFLH